MTLNDLFDRIVERALAEAEAKRISIHTFAFYYDHESAAVSVCIDTEENSWQAAKRINAYSAKHFLSAVADGDLKGAAMWNVNGDRNFALGDFYLVNLARTDLAEARADNEFFQSMLQAVVRNQPAISRLADNKDRLMLCCSGPDDEVQFVWSAIEAQK